MREIIVNILIVNDDRSEVSQLKKDLAESGEFTGELVVVRTLEEGRKRLAKGGIDVVMIDIRTLGVPVSDSFAGFYKQFSSVPMILITGPDQLEIAARTLSKGAQDYLVRGRMDRSILVRAVTNAIERKKVEDDYLQLEEQFRYMQKMDSLGALAGGIAHDFNNLLVAIMGNADLAMMEIDVASPARKRIEKIIGAAHRAAQLSNQLLAYTGRSKFVVSSVKFNELVVDMDPLIRASVSRKVKISLDLATNLPPVTADPSQLRQLLINLVTNASEALEEKPGSVELRTFRLKVDDEQKDPLFVEGSLLGGEYIVLEVSDSGCGMDEETRSRMFDPFFSRKFVGRGLGLAAVRGIVRSHGGVISVESSPGKGTNIRVYLPKTEVEPEIQAALDMGVPRKGMEGHGIVLVVDDEEDVRDLAQEVLERIGFEVLTAVDGREGVGIFKENSDKIDVVLLDMTMPRMNGAEAFEKMRAIRNDVRVILSSGYTEDEVTIDFTRQGFAGFLQKPYRPAILRETILKVVKG